MLTELEGFYPARTTRIPYIEYPSSLTYPAMGNKLLGRDIHAFEKVPHTKGCIKRQYRGRKILG